MQKIRKNILLTPGPATTTDSVKNAQLVPDICPREKDFSDVLRYISDELAGLVGATGQYAAILFGGSGTAAVESILSSVIGKDTAIIIINNGAYGRRMCQIAEIYDIDFIEFKSSPVEPIDIERLKETLQSSNKTISHLCVVHNETTTGLLNDIEAIGNLCENHGIKMIVDAISSYGAIPINMKKYHINYLAATSNKCLQGMPGIGFVIANIESLEAAKDIKQRNLYLNLYEQYRFFMETLQIRFTPPVQTIYALKQAIIETKEEGCKQRYARYVKSWETLIAGLKRMNLTHLVAEKHHSKIITAIIEPVYEKYNFNDMHDYFYKKDFTIYPGKLDYLNTFRISNMGNIDHRDIESFLLLLEEYLKKIGYLK